MRWARWGGPCGGGRGNRGMGVATEERVLPSSRQQEGEGPGAVRAAQRGGGGGRSDWTGPAAQDCTAGGSGGPVRKPYLVKN